MVLKLAACAAFAAAMLAIGGAPPALAASSGMAAEFPVGTCIDYRNDHLAFDTEDLRYTTAVPGTDPGRDYRVVAQVANVTRCGPETDWEYTTRDMVVLCVVQDQPAVAAPIFGG
jgi:hypothetical protein